MSLAAPAACRLQTTYLGLDLSSPVIVGASPLAEDIDALRRLEEQGAGAVVMPSLFEEQYIVDREALSAHTEPHFWNSPEAGSYLPQADDFAFRPDRYFDQVRAAKDALDIPVIASINGTTAGGWLDYALDIQSAGADALELNVYRVPADDLRSGLDVELELYELVRAVRARLHIPFAVKLSPFFTVLPQVIGNLASRGAQGVVLFNRFLQPDFDIETLEVVSRAQLSSPSDLLLRLRWLALLHGRYPLSLALSGGIHRAEDIVKGIMAGADTVQVVSYLLRHGVESFAGLMAGFCRWLETHGVDDIADMRGCLSLGRCPDPSAFERAHYMKVLQGWKS
jgi:dihydroorotate dehydrogenase (fumarate)